MALLRLLWPCAAIALSAVAQAAPAPFALAAAPFTAPVMPEVLAELRGGFDLGNGLSASIGIERSTAINGAIITTQTVQIPDLARMTAVQAAQLRSVLGDVTLIRNGTGNVFAGAPAQAPAGAIVVQNTLDDQTLRNLTVISTTSNSLRLLQGVNAAGALRDALLAPLAPRP